MGTRQLHERAAKLLDAVRQRSSLDERAMLLLLAAELLAFADDVRELPHQARVPAPSWSNASR